MAKKREEWIESKDGYVSLPIYSTGWRSKRGNIGDEDAGGLVFWLDSDRKPTSKQIWMDEAFADPAQAERQVERALDELEWAARRAELCKQAYEIMQEHRYKIDPSMKRREIRISVVWPKGKRPELKLKKRS